MRMHSPRALIRIVLLIALLGLASGLGRPRQAAHADGQITLQVINGRTGLLHITATGLPPLTPLDFTVQQITIALPGVVVRYLTIVSTATGTIDTDYFLGEFLCGSMVRVDIAAVDPFRGSSATVLAQCPGTNPAIAITGVTSGNVALVSGTGFNINETVGISISSQLTGFFTGVTVQSDPNGALTAQVPLGAIGCGSEVLTPHAAGLAGSLATGVAFPFPCTYTPAVPPTATPSPTPAPPSVAAGNTVARASAAPIRVSNAPAIVRYKQTETIRVETGTPNLQVQARLQAVGLRLAEVSVRTDARGLATIPYTVTLKLKAGQRLPVRYVVSFSLNGHAQRQEGQFLISNG